MKGTRQDWIPAGSGKAVYCENSPTPGHWERSEANPISSLEEAGSHLGDCFAAPLLAMTSLLARPFIFMLRGCPARH